LEAIKFVRPAVTVFVILEADVKKNFGNKNPTPQVIFAKVYP